MLSCTISLCTKDICVTREGEHKTRPVTPNYQVTQGWQGPVRRIGMEHVMDCYVIWKFDKNIDGAKQFLVDYIDHFRDGFMNSQFYNFPCFPGTVPDLGRAHV